MQMRGGFLFNDVLIHMIRYIIFCFLLFVFSVTRAQQFGGEPASVKWKQINNDTVKIILREGLNNCSC